MPVLTLLPDGRTVDVQHKNSLLEACRQAGYPLPASCGGKGTCGKCRVRIVDGCPEDSGAHRSLGASAVREGWRLACRVRVEHDMTVDLSHLVPLRQRILTDFAAAPVEADAGLEVHDLDLGVPTLDDPSPDYERLARALRRERLLRCSLPMLRVLPARLRSANWQVRAVLADQELLGLLSRIDARPLGVAVDIGTTTLAAALFDVSNGRTLGVSSRSNPQAAFGDDVVSRIEHAGKGTAELRELQALVVAECNAMIGELCRDASASPADVCLCTFAANTTMTHLLLGIDPSALAAAPFVPATLAGQTVSASELGLQISPGGWAMALPCLGPYLGSDITAGLLALGMQKGASTRLLIDVGTNGEIALAHNGKLYGCSTAAGPAFEGARIAQGMRAADGAIRGVSVVDGDLAVAVVGDDPARGICGTGLLDAVACLLDLGLIDETGCILEQDDLPDALPASLRTRLVEVDDAPAVRLADEVFLRQRDVRELQLAKGAIAAGVQVLLQAAGVEPDAVEQVFLAGAFGSYLRPESALRIGLLPEGIRRESVVAAGNTALAGARLALLNRIVREEARSVSHFVQCIELSGRLDFQTAFSECMEFTPA